MFPSVSPNALAEIIKKNGCHRQRCIEDLSHSCGGGQYNLPSQLGNFNLQQNRTPSDSRTQGPSSGARSRSVSGVPGASSAEENRSYGYGYPGRGRTPQSAPVLPSGHFPYQCRGGFLFSNSAISDSANSVYQTQQYASPGSHESGAPYSPAGPASIFQPTKANNQRHPLAYSQYPGVGGDGPRQQYNVYPSLSKFGDGTPGATSTTPPVRHTSTLNVIPGSPPPYGWSPSLGTHSTSVNLQLGPPPPNDSQHPKVQIITSGNMNYAGGDATHTGENVPPWLGSPVASSSPQQPSSSMPYQSQLCISISPNGGSISAMRSQMHSPLSLAPARYHPNQIAADRHSPVNVGLGPVYPSSPGNRLSPSSQASPRTSPKFAEDSFTKTCSIFDQDDPEQEKVTHAPLKPVPSPVPAWQNVSPVWPRPAMPSNVALGNELYGGEAYSRALLTHQHQKFSTLQRDLEREQAQLLDIRREVARVEFHFFQQVPCKDRIFFSFDDLQRLRSEVRSLMVDCACMTRLVDLLHRGEVPLGETNEDFYRSINTGQQGPVLPSVRSNLPVAPPATAHQVTSRPRPSTPPPQPQRPSPLQELAPPASSTRQPPPQQQDDDDESQKWACCTCTFHNDPAMVICEMCEMPKFVQAPMSNQGDAFPSNN